MEEEKEEKRRGESEIGGGPKCDGGNCQSMIVQQEQEGGGEGDGIGDRPGTPAVEDGDRRARQREKNGEPGETLQCESGDWGSRIAGVGIGVFPGIDEEAVEAAQRSEEQGEWEQARTEARTTGDGGYKGCSGEEEADGNFFGKEVRNLPLGCGVADGVDEEEVNEDEDCEDEVEVDGPGFEVGQKQSEDDGGKKDSEEEDGTVAVVEVVAGFEAREVGWVGVE